MFNKTFVIVIVIVILNHFTAASNIRELASPRLFIFTVSQLILLDLKFMTIVR